MMELENRLSIVLSHLNKAIMEVSGTTERDWLILSRDNIEKTIWHLKNDKKRLK